MSETLAAPIRKATPADAPLLSTLLTDVFFTDPVALWLFPDQTQRRQALPRFFGVHADMSIAHNCAYTTDDLRGVILGTPSTALGDAWCQRLRDSAGDRAHALDTITALEQQHIPAGEFGFITFLAVAADRRGRDLGAALGEHVCAHFDAQNLPQYLETSSPGGTRIAARFGFRPLGDDIRLPHGPASHPMWRPAAVLEATWPQNPAMSL